MILSEIAQQFKFDVIPSAQHADHLPHTVASQLLEQEVVVFAVNDEDSDTAQFSERYGFSFDDCANTIVLRYKKDGAEHYAAVITLGSNRLDVNGAVKQCLGAQRLSFAKREVATEITGMEFGGITAFGLPGDMRILIDQAVMDRQYLVMGAGIRKTKIFLAPALLKRLPQAAVAPLTLA
ncbi:YbaK/EbsC family protein [Janthinobacterium fluminis]|uniref:YbaK/EbsC family protein n=1 Tax=Janthinobacterium fluminis TaxID=2987524 RepID=A0ABT5K0A5_9BURK|nr:YbaK/EbsC family protein [Janthinobacterium fluminis]MDC8758408.1 YbaK/EbsC family protein [Janthinobacterium fluminis]